MKNNISKKRRVYLDWAAAAPICIEALHAANAVRSAYGNPSSPHQEGKYAREIIENARKVIARYIEAIPDDLIFTSGATEANNLAIRGHLTALVTNKRKPKDIHLLYAPTAHSSITHTAKTLAEEGFFVEPLPITAQGVVDITALRSCIRKETALVSMEAISGETGIIWNTREVANILSHIPHNTLRPLLHIDATHTPYTECVTRTYWGADMLVFDAQKIGAMRGIGVLVSHRTIALRQLMNGGSQERSIRPGTEPTTLIASFAAAFQSCDVSREHFRARAIRNRTTLIKYISAIPRTFINSGVHTVSHILNVSFLGRDTDYLTMLLDEAGFAVSTKSACETDNIGSHSVAILTGNIARSISTLRISFGPTTTYTDIHRFIKALIKAVAFIDENTI